MKSEARVVVIGGGVVGASVLYHLTRAGWKDALLIERGELTCGSTWHAAGGMHTLNGDPNVARLQQYTINLYKELEKISGQSCGLHMPGGIMLAGTRERFDWLQQWVANQADIIRTPGTESNVKEIYDKCAELAEDGENVIRRGSLPEQVYPVKGNLVEIEDEHVDGFLRAIPGSEIQELEAPASKEEAKQ